jgi:hypothetical protein
MKGEVKNPVTVWLLGLLCFPVGLYQFFIWFTELKNYLGRDDLNPVIEMVLLFLCMPFAIFRLGGYVQEAQIRAGMPTADNQGIMFIVYMMLCGYGYSVIQGEMNRIWESGGGSPATF